MNLNQGIELYVQEKRAAGMLFGKGNQSLASFRRQVGDLSLSRIRPEQIVTFLNGPRTSDITWVHKYNLLRNFFLFWAARDRMRPLPMPPPRRPAPQNFTPNIYSQAEIRLLLSSTRAAQESSASRIDARTLRTFLLFLYGTGGYSLSEPCSVVDVARRNRLESACSQRFGTSTVHRRRTKQLYHVAAPAKDEDVP